ncbi:HdeA/HdeB family chaperone [Vibrio mediterranei]
MSKRIKKLVFEGVVGLCSLVTILAYAANAQPENTGEMTLSQPIATASFESTMTCSEFLELDYDLMPVTLGYLVAWNYKSNNEVQVFDITQLDAIEIDEIVDQCHKAPAARVHKVVAKQLADAKSEQIEKLL